MFGRIYRKMICVYRDLSIRYKLLLVTTVFIIVPTFVIAWSSYNKSAEVVQNKSIEYNNKILQAIELSISNYLEDIVQISQDILYTEEVYEVLADEDNSKTELTSYENSNKLKSILTSKLLSSDVSDSMCIIDNDYNIYSVNLDNSKVKIEENMPKMFLKVFARSYDGKPGWHIHSDMDGNKEIYMVRLIYDRTRFNEIGFMAIRLNLEYIRNRLELVEDDALLELFITSSNNDIVVQRTTDGYGNNYSRLSDIKTYYKNKNVMFNSIEMDDLKMTIHYITSLDILFKEVDVIKNWIFSITIISVLVMLFVILLVELDIASAINNTITAMLSFNKSESGQRIRVDRNDELGYLATAFNDMSDEINHLLNEVYGEQLMRKDAQIKALQSQINPHFLFNTLEAINCMALLNDVPEISETVGDLSGLLEVSIGRDDELITIKDEVKYLDNYINIFRRRFGDEKLKIIKEVDEAILHVNIPRLLLQPIVENAIKHGIEQKIGLGTIRIGIYKKNRKLYVEIEDDGYGISKDKVDYLNGLFDLEKPNKEKMRSGYSNSIGLINVNKRLKLIYGEKYGMQIISEPNIRTVVKMSMPINGDGDTHV